MRLHEIFQPNHRALRKITAAAKQQLVEGQLAILISQNSQRSFAIEPGTSTTPTATAATTKKPFAVEG